jgi:acyl-CoA thioester hydrolase
MSFDAPVIAPARGLDPAWLDYNGHLNMAYYNVLFDKAVDHAFALIGCGPDYVKTQYELFHGGSTCVLLRELKPDAQVQHPVQLLDHDAKRLHLLSGNPSCGGLGLGDLRNAAAACRHERPRAAADARRHFRQGSKMAEAHANLPRPNGPDVRCGSCAKIRVDRIRHARHSPRHASTHQAMGHPQHPRLSRKPAAGDLALSLLIGLSVALAAIAFPMADRPGAALLAWQHQRTGALGGPPHTLVHDPRRAR